MPTLIESLVEQARGYSAIEVIAVVSAVLYLLLAIRQSIWCWLFAAISTAIYIYLFITVRLYMESVLNLFYLGMAVYGWYAWTHGSGPEHKLSVSSWPWRRHATAILAIVTISLLNGMALERWSNAAFPYIDSLTTWGAVWTTFLVARKVLENWWYWLAIDSVSVFVYWSRDLELTALLFVIYILMIPFGLWTWTKSFRQARA